ncbi:DoxX family protein [soil metagenome]
MKTISLYLMAALYVAAGIYHFVNPAMYVSIMPPWLPYHKALVAISGVCEVALGLLLIFPATRRFAAWGIIALLVAVFPANIQMLLNFIHDKNPMTWVAIVRLPIQLLLIWWAYGFAKKNS